MPWKRQLKRAVHRTLAVAGYELIRPTGRRLTLRRRLVMGRDHLADIKRILGGRAHCIFDVGAHVGDTVVAFAGAFPEATIYAFEPEPANYSRLCEQVRSLGGVRTIQAAIGEEDGTSVMFVNESSDTNSLLPTAAGATEYLAAPDMMRLDHTTSVEVKTLDRFCAERGVEQIDLLKIDTQGYELHVLNGIATAMGAGRVPLIYLEVGFVPFYEGQPLFHELYAYLYERGYRLVGLYESGYENHYYQVGGNALFVHESMGVRRGPGARPRPSIP